METAAGETKMRTDEEIRDIARAEVDARVEEIAKMAAKNVINHFYQEVGKGVLKKAAIILGAAILSILGWLAGKGFLPSP